MELLIHSIKILYVREKRLSNTNSCGGGIVGEKRIARGEGNDSAQLFAHNFRTRFQTLQSQL